MVNKYKKHNKYCPPEIVPHVFCGIIMNLAIKKNPEVKRLYEQLKVDLKLPGCQKLFRPLVSPDIRVAKRLAKEAGYSLEKGPPDINQMVLIRNILSAMFRIVKKDASRFQFWGFFTPWLTRDISKFKKDLEQFILMGFNRESDWKRGKARVTLARSEKLEQAIVLQAFWEVNGINFEDVMGMKSFPYGKESYSLNLEMNEKLPDRAKREIVGQSIEAGFERLDVEKIAMIALHWYESRVVHAGPQEYCLYLAKTEEESLDVSNLSNEIRICDQALGYERLKTGRRKKP